MQITGLAEEDILFVRFEGEGGQHCLPYFIALDREKQAVVLSIRGTLSLQDAMTGAVSLRLALFNTVMIGLYCWTSALCCACIAT